MTTDECLIKIIAEYEHLKNSVQGWYPQNPEVKVAEDNYHYVMFAVACSALIERYLQERK